MDSQSNNDFIDIGISIDDGGVQFENSFLVCLIAATLLERVFQIIYILFT